MGGLTDPRDGSENMIFIEKLTIDCHIPRTQGEFNAVMGRCKARGIVMIREKTGLIPVDPASWPNPTKEEV